MTNEVDHKTAFEPPLGCDVREWQFADRPPPGYVKQYGRAEAGDLAYWNNESEWRQVEYGQNIVGAYERELWDMGILALATRAPNAQGNRLATTNQTKE